MTLKPGTMLGPYEILSLIGAGGMGEVYKARDTRLERIVAIKVLPAHLAERADLRERFEREARAIANLQHPNICVLYDIGSHDGIHYLVMEYLDGETVAQRLMKGPLALEQVLKYAIEVSDALDKAHRQGYTHRDIKPSNIMLTKAGSAKVLDFGLAKLKQEAVIKPPLSQSQIPTPPSGVPLPDPGVPGAAHRTGLTADGTLLGTLQYMAPEQVEGKVDELDGRTDIFAFGAVLYEMVTGQKAFEGKTQASLIAKILETDPPPLSSLQPMTPPSVGRVVKRCLAKEPEKRWQSANDLCDELKWISEGGSQAGMPAPVVARRKLHERLAWALAAVAVLVAGALAVPYFTGTQTQPELMRLSVVTPEVPAPFDVSVSPDGRRLAFLARGSSGKLLLWVRPLDSLSAQPLPGTEEAVWPFWSPDSRFLGFFAQGKLKKIAIAGGPPETLCDVGAATRGGTWNQAGVILFSPGTAGGLFRVSAAGGIPAPVTTIDPGKETSHRWPQFLPDGNHFLYWSQSARAGGSAIAIGSLDSQETRRLLDSPFLARYAAPGFLFFYREGALMAQPFDAGRMQLAGEPVRVAEQLPSNTNSGEVDFSASDNGVLAYVSSAGAGANSQLAWFDRAGKQMDLLGQPALYSIPALSPDGKRVAVHANDPQSGNADIWLLDAASGSATRFTFHPSRNRKPLWSPDGERIAFMSNRQGPYALFQKPSSGAGGEELLFKGEFTANPQDWSSDGRFLLYNVLDAKGDRHLSVLPLSGERKPFLFSETAVNQYYPKLSPDGRWIAYVSNESGRYEVYVQNFPKAVGKWQVSRNGGTQPRWRRDGKELFYLALDGKFMAVAVRADSTFEVGVPTLLFETRIFGGPTVDATAGHQYDVSPDGQRFLVNLETEQVSATPLTVVLNWPAGLKQ